MAVTRDNGRWIVWSSLLSGVTATSNGTWVNVDMIHPFSVTASGSFSATLKVYVSNAPTKPSDSDNNHAQLGSDITGASSVLSDGPYKWVKVRVATYTSGTVNADVAGAASVATLPR